MSKKEKLLERFKTKPSDFTWAELNGMLSGLGYELLTVGKTGGSRVKFLHPVHPSINMHKPHPTPVLKKYQIKQIKELLKKDGLV